MSACSAATRSPVAPIAATIIGTGRCMGAGWWSSSARRRRTSAITPALCTHRCATEGNGSPASACSWRMCPAPMPSSRRPPDSRSRVAASRASSAGFQK